MELRQLKYFVTLAEELHFRKAAEKLFIVQPALSRQIKQLEEELGITLFKRTKRTVQLTESGKFLYQETQDIFSRLNQLKSKVREIENGTTGKIRVGYVPSAMHNILPRIIAKIQKGLPGLHFELNQMTALQQVEMLKADKIDLGFLRVPRKDAEIMDQVIFTETYSLVLPSNHKINTKNFKGLQQFAHENFILTPRSAGEMYFDNIIALFSAAGFSPKIVHESVYEHATIKLVENNLGISIIPTSFKDGFNANVKFIELKNIPQRLKLSMAWKKDHSNRSLLALMDFIKKNIPKK